VRNVCLIEDLIEEIMDESSIEDPLEACFTHFREDLDLDKLLEQVDAILESIPLESSETEETTTLEPLRRNLNLYRTILSISS
jgi:hypothetical protein